MYPLKSGGIVYVSRINSDRVGALISLSLRFPFLTTHPARATLSA